MAEQVRKRRRRRRSKNRMMTQQSTTSKQLSEISAAAPAQPEEKIRFVRLDAKSRDFPLQWLQFAARARKGWEQGAPYMPQEAILVNWRDHVQKAPDVIPIWLMLDGELVVGHLVAEAEIYHGRPFIAVHQLVVDRRDITKALKRGLMAAFLDWIRSLNEMLEKTQGKKYPHRFDALRFLTPHSAKFWQHWLPGFELTFEERMLLFKLPNSET